MATPIRGLRYAFKLGVVVVEEVYNISCLEQQLSIQTVLTYTRLLVRLQGVPGVTPANGTVLCVLAGMLAASVAMITSYCRVNNIQPQGK